MTRMQIEKIGDNKESEKVIDNLKFLLTEKVKQKKRRDNLQFIVEQIGNEKALKSKFPNTKISYEDNKIIIELGEKQ